MLRSLLFPCVRCCMGPARAELECLNSYAADGEPQHARTSVSRPNQHFQTLFSAFDGDDHDCSGTVSDSSLQEADEHVPTASSFVERRWRSLLHGKQEIPQDIPDGATSSGAMLSSAPSTVEYIEYLESGSQWSASTVSDEPLASTASGVTVTAEGLALHNSIYAGTEDNFEKFFSEEGDGAMYGRSFVSSVLSAIAKHALGWCVHERAQTVHQAPPSVQQTSESLRKARRGQKRGRKRSGVRRECESQWARVSTWAATWDLDADFSADQGDMLHAAVTGTLSEPVLRMKDLLDSVGVQAAH